MRDGYSQNMLFLFFLQVNLAEAFTFDHDITLLIDYEDSFTPHVVYEEGDPDGGKLSKITIIL